METDGNGKNRHGYRHKPSKDDGQKLKKRMNLAGYLKGRGL